MEFKFKIIKLGELCSVKGGTRLPKGKMPLKQKTDYPYARISNLYSHKFMELDSDFVYLPSEVHAETKNYTISSGELIMAIVGSTLGMVAIAGESIQNVVFSDNCVKLVGLKEVSTEYLYYFLKSEYGKRQIEKHSIGTSQPKLPIYSLKNIEVLVPPKKQQDKIVTILSRIDKKILTNLRLNSCLRELGEMIFKRWFVDYEFPDESGEAYFSSGGEMAESPRGKIPKDFTLAFLEQYIFEQRNGDWGESEKKKNCEKKVYSLRGVDIANIAKGLPIAPHVRYIKEKNAEGKILWDGDIVVEISGGTNSQSTGRVMLTTDILLKMFSYPAVCTNYCKKIRPANPEYAGFFYALFNYLYANDVFFAYENGTTTIKNLDFNSFAGKYELIMPEQSLISRFSLIQEKLLNTVYQNSFQNEKLGGIRDSLMLKLLTEGKEKKGRQ